MTTSFPLGFGDVVASSQRRIFGSEKAFSFWNGRGLVGRVAGAHLLHRIAAAAAGRLLRSRRKTRAPPLFGSGRGEGRDFALVFGPLPRHDEPAVTIGGVFVIFFVAAVERLFEVWGVAFVKVLFVDLGPVVDGVVGRENVLLVSRLER